MDLSAWTSSTFLPQEYLNTELKRHLFKARVRGDGISEFHANDGSHDDCDLVAHEEIAVSLSGFVAGTSLTPGVMVPCEETSDLESFGSIVYSHLRPDGIGG